MHPPKESQRINYATAYILNVTHLYDLVTNCNIQKEYDLCGHFNHPNECKYGITTKITYTKVKQG